MSTVLGFLKRVLSVVNPPTAQPLADSKPIKFGILGAAAIAPQALIIPVKTHSEAVIYAVAARDKQRATAYAKKHGIEKVYGGPTGYQDLLNDPEVDAIYNPLPNGLHFEWTMKALAAGKHVLLEKPSANTADETRQMFDLAARKGLVLLEAFHYRFHPAIQRAKAIIDSGELGALTHVSAELAIPSGAFKSDDIRYNYDLGGGGLMDMGCYTLNCIRYLASANPTAVLSATHTLLPRDATVDRGTRAELALPHDATAALMVDLALPPALGFIPRLPRITVRVACAGGAVEMYNYLMPTLYHTITVTRKTGRGVQTRVEKAYTFAEAKMEGRGEVWWTTYRYQLEAFVDRLKGRTPQTWITPEDSVGNMQAVEAVYAKTGLGSRPKSEFVATI